MPPTYTHSPNLYVVIPAQAGIQTFKTVIPASKAKGRCASRNWIPDSRYALSGMTE